MPNPIPELTAVLAEARHIEAAGDVIIAVCDSVRVAFNGRLKVTFKAADGDDFTFTIGPEDAGRYIPTRSYRVVLPGTTSLS